MRNVRHEGSEVDTDCYMRCQTISTVKLVSAAHRARKPPLELGLCIDASETGKKDEDRVQEEHSSWRGGNGEVLDARLKRKG